MIARSKDTRTLISTNDNILVLIEIKYIELVTISKIAMRTFLTVYLRNMLVK